MIEFQDVNGNTVRLEFKKNAFSIPPRHVLVICRYKNKWLLTRHKKRGLEFPGGKAEDGETVEEAAVREVFEETGAVIHELRYLGEYEVSTGKETFVKAIFYGEADAILDRDSYCETEGPVLLEGNILDLRRGPDFSFIMKDQVIEKSLRLIKEGIPKR